MDQIMGPNPNAILGIKDDKKCTKQVSPQTKLCKHRPNSIFTSQISSYFHLYQSFSTYSQNHHTTKITRTRTLNILFQQQ